MTKYIKKPIVIDAFKWDGTVKCLLDNVDDNNKHDFWFTKWSSTGDPQYDDSVENLTAEADNDEYFNLYINRGRVHIETSDGGQILKKGYYAIKGLNGDYYPCSPDTFAKTYEKVKK